MAETASELLRRTAIAIAMASSSLTLTPRRRASHPEGPSLLVGRVGWSLAARDDPRMKGEAGGARRNIFRATQHDTHPRRDRHLLPAMSRAKHNRRLRAALARSHSSSEHEIAPPWQLELWQLELSLTSCERGPKISLPPKHPSIHLRLREGAGASLQRDQVPGGGAVGF